MPKITFVDIALWILVAAGFVGGLNLSIINFKGVPCPHLGFVPVCYVVTAAYALMIVAIIIRHNGIKHYCFAAGWGTAFVIALLASIAEFFAGGGVCPTSGGSVRGAGGSTPLCYISLAMLVAILVLFLFGPYRRACALENEN